MDLARSCRDFRISRSCRDLGGMARWIQIYAQILQDLSKISQDFTGFHRTTQDFTGLFQISMYLTKFYPGRLRDHCEFATHSSPSGSSTRWDSVTEWSHKSVCNCTQQVPERLLFRTIVPATECSGHGFEKHHDILINIKILNGESMIGIWRFQCRFW